jgi:site-specific DNA-methyltransferase (adenine-specific)
MEGIPDGSIDLILCDPPYGTTGSKWDSVIPIETMFTAFRRILTDRGTAVVFGTEPFCSHVRMTALDLYKYDWIWKKTTVTGYAHARNMPLRDYENIMVFSKGKVGHASRLGGGRMVYNPQGLIACEQVDHTDKTSSVLHSRLFTDGAEATYIRTETNFPRMVLNFQKNAKDTKFHVNAKPVPLLEYLVLTYTDEDATVLDNCMGSGSVGVACLNTGRNFLGMELDAHYFEVARERIAAAQTEMVQ